MASQIQLTRSGISGVQPAASELEYGELALNYADGKLFYKDDSNNLKAINDTYQNSNNTIFVNSTNSAEPMIGLNTTSPEYLLDLGGSTGSQHNSLRIHQTNGGTAIRIGAGGGGSDVTLLRVDGDSSNVSDGSSENNEFGFSLRYIGTGSGNLNKFAIMSDDSNGADTQIPAFQILQDGTVGMGKTTSFVPFDGVSVDVEDDIQVTGSTPTLRLHKTDGDDTHDQTWLTIGTSTTDNAFEMQTRSSSGVFLSNDYRIIKNSSGALNHQWSIGGSEKARLDSTGLGIGTTSPEQKVHVRDGAPRLLLDGFSAVSENDEISRLAGLWDGTYVADIRFLAGDDTADKDNGKIEFRTFVSSGSTTRSMIIDEVGNIGIGNIDPTVKLEVDGNAIAAEPTASTHLTTKAYVDSQLTLGISNPTYTGNQALSARTTIRAGYAIQHQMAHYDVFKGYTGNTNGSTPTYIDVLDIKMTPRDNNSCFKIDAMINFENNGNSENLVFRLYRKIGTGNFTQVGGSNDSNNSNSMKGMATAFYDNNEDSTMNNVKLQFIDAPNTASEVTYSIAFITNTSSVFTLNRVYTGSNSAAYEYGSSNMIIAELAGI